jgi:pimeloyl-ACP methyl ester carboxylesterase
MPSTRAPKRSKRPKTSRPRSSAAATKQRPKEQTTKAKTKSTRGKGSLAAGGKSLAASGGLAQAPEHIIVFVPGFMGSKLRDKKTGKLVWLDFSQAGANPLKWPAWLDNLANQMIYPNDNLEPDGIIEDVLFAPPWIKQEQYGRLLKTLEDWGYRVNPKKFPENKLNVYTFAYDWRQDNRISGKQLGAAVERWSAMHPGAQVWLMGHSNGGIVSRWYIEKEGGKDKVSRLILLASPWDGAIKAVYMLFQGLDVVFRVKFNLFGLPERTRAALRTFPSAYQLVPTRVLLHDAQGEEVSAFAGDSWLDDPKQQKLLEDGHKFNEELGNELSVDTVAFFGRKLMTTSAGLVHRAAGGRWSKVDWEDTETGDGTLPEYTAIFKATNRNIPVVAGHGDIYVNTALTEILRWELIDKFSGLMAGRVEAVTEDLRIIFETDKDVYAPGESIGLRTEIKRVKKGTAVSKAAVKVKLAWLQTLPGTARTARPKKLPEVELAPKQKAKGEFSGSLKAPRAEGYYELQVTITLPTADTVSLTEMIAVEAAS